jgi:hypothetical protein
MPSERRVIHSFPVASKAGKPQQIEPPHVGNHRDIGERKDRPCEIAVARQRAFDSRPGPLSERQAGSPPAVATILGVTRVRITEEGRRALSCSK